MVNYSCKWSLQSFLHIKAFPLHDAICEVWGQEKESCSYQLPLLQARICHLPALLSWGRGYLFTSPSEPVPTSFYFHSKCAEVNNLSATGPQHMPGYVNILPGRQLYPQHGRCRSLSKIREKRKARRGVPTAPKALRRGCQFWCCTPWWGSPVLHAQGTDSVTLSLLTVVFHRETR